MSALQPQSDTALDRVANALASEAARAELYRYATGVAEVLPPDSSSWFVVGAVIQVNAITRNELVALSAVVKKGGTILAGLNTLIEWLPGYGRSALAAAACMGITGCFLTVWLWTNAYNAGWNASNVAGYAPIATQVCKSLANVRHQLALVNEHAAVDQMQFEMTGRRCPFTPPVKPPRAMPGAEQRPPSVGSTSVAGGIKGRYARPSAALDTPGCHDPGDRRRRAERERTIEASSGFRPRGVAPDPKGLLGSGQPRHITPANGCAPREFAGSGCSAYDPAILPADRFFLARGHLNESKSGPLDLAPSAPPRPRRTDQQTTARGRLLRLALWSTG